MVAKFQLLALAFGAATAFAAPVPSKTQPESTFPTSPATKYFIKLFDSWGWKRDNDHKDIFPPFYGLPPWHTAPSKPPATKPAPTEKRDEDNRPIVLPAPISQPIFPPGLSPYPPGMSPIRARSVEPTTVEKRDKDSNDVVMLPPSLLCRLGLPGCLSSKRDIEPSELPGMQAVI